MEFKQCPRCRCMKNIRKNKVMCKGCEDNFTLERKNTHNVQKENHSQEKPGKETAAKELGTTMMQKTSIPDSLTGNLNKENPK